MGTTQPGRIVNYSIVGFAAVLGLAASSTHAASSSADSVPYSTPAGITLVDVSKILASSSDQFLWRRLGDADGKPLYTYDKDSRAGESTCFDECAKEFPPLLVASHAAAFGDWSIVNRSDHIRQWAYQGKPLYRYSGQDPTGEPFGGDTATQIAENPAWQDPASKFYSPKPGWRRAAYTPEKTTVVPAGIALQSLAVANGFGLVDSMTGMTIYAVPAARNLSRAWNPVYAPALARPIGEFSIVGREDGTQQWAFKGKSLYTFAGDYAPGEVTGIFAEKNINAALAYRNFMPSSIAIRLLPGRGPLMMTTSGLSVYTQARYNLQYGGRETRTGYSIPYNDAKAVGTRGCVGECTATWKPVAAPANAQSSGFWEVAVRADGSKQWVYKGSPLYSYVGDKKPGDIEGNNRHDIVYGDPQGKISLAVTIGEKPLGDSANNYREAGSGFYWHLATLSY